MHSMHFSSFMERKCSFKMNKIYSNEFISFTATLDGNVISFIWCDRENDKCSRIKLHLHKWLPPQNLHNTYMLIYTTISLFLTKMKSHVGFLGNWLNWKAELQKKITKISSSKTHYTITKEKYFVGIEKSIDSEK